MADPFKKQIVRYHTPDGKRCTSGTPGAVRTVEESAKWYGTVNGEAVPLCRDKSKARQLLHKLLTDATMRQHGMGDPYEEHRKRPLADHLDDYRRELEARGNAPRYVQLVFSRLTALLDGCAFRFMADLSASRVMDWLADLRASGEPCKPLPEGRELFTFKETAALLGITLPSLGEAVRREGVEPVRVEGERSRYLPRAAVEAMRDRRAQGASVQTTNYYLSHLKSFCRWLVKDRRAADSPVAHLDAGNVEVDRRHDRCELDADELRRLLQATRSSNRTFRGLTGEDRFVLYATACGTGLRAGGLASLTPESFDLGTGSPTLTLSAKRNKSRVARVQPIPEDVADLLRQYLATKPAGRPAWGGTWARAGKGAVMLRHDLEAAGIAYAVEGPDGPLYRDFHALRHSYITALGRGGVDLRTAQELAGHSTPTLTARYSHRRLYDLAGAVEKLPGFLPTGEGGGEAQALPGDRDGRS